MTSAARSVGRPPVTSRDDIERVAMQLFSRHGFDATTVDDIAAAAGIGRRTFFRYFGSKNDVVWGRFAEGLVEFRATLAATPDNIAIGAALRTAIVAFNALTPDQVPVHRQRMTVIFSAESLLAHSTLMYAEWRDVVAAFVAGRTGEPTGALLPRLVGHVMLGAAVAAYEQWLADPTADLATLLDTTVAHAAACLPG
jgi:mycofactocin system transcriptional regulator